MSELCLQDEIVDLKSATPTLSEDQKPGSHGLNPVITPSGHASPDYQVDRTSGRITWPVKGFIQHVPPENVTSTKFMRGKVPTGDAHICYCQSSASFCRELSPLFRGSGCVLYYGTARVLLMVEDALLWLRIYKPHSVYRPYGLILEGALDH